jgi:hypothetical protein
MRVEETWLNRTCRVHVFMPPNQWLLAVGYLSLRRLASLLETFHFCLTYQVQWDREDGAQHPTARRMAPPQRILQPPMSTGSIEKPALNRNLLCLPSLVCFISLQMEHLLSWHANALHAHTRAHCAHRLPRHVD